MELIDPFHLTSFYYNSDLEQGMALMVIADFNWISIFLKHYSIIL